MPTKDHIVKQLRAYADAIDDGSLSARNAILFVGDMVVFHDAVARNDANFARVDEMVALWKAMEPVHAD